MKHILSVSLGSDSRDSSVIQNFLGQDILIERKGTNGNKDKLCELIRQYDGKVDAFGLGGTDLYIYSAGRRYTFRESEQITKNAKLTPIVDGSGIKNTLERQLPNILSSKYNLQLQGKKILIVSAIDRFGLAEAISSINCDITYGDLVYGLGINYPLHSLATLNKIAALLLPIITKLPVKYIYPMGDKQTMQEARYPQYFYENEVIAGDFHFIRRFMPSNMHKKIIITNTVTPSDTALLKERGVSLLVTTTPQMQGRSFGTNVLEALLVALNDGRQGDYCELSNKLDINPRVEYLN